MNIQFEQVKRNEHSQATWNAIHYADMGVETSKEEFEMDIAYQTFVNNWNSLCSMGGTCFQGYEVEDRQSKKMITSAFTSDYPDSSNFLDKTKGSILVLGFKDGKDHQTYVNSRLEMFDIMDKYLRHYYFETELK